VIIEEMNMYFDTPRDFVDGVYEELVYGDHPLGWDIIGRKETVQGATRDSFLDYIGNWYKPSRMVVGVGGRIGDDLVERIADLFGDLEDAPTGAPLPALSPVNGSRVRVHTKASDQAHICLGVRSRPIVDPDRYVLMVLSTVLGGGMSSRLFTEVRERRGLAYYVFATNHAYTDAGSLYAQAGVDIERIDDAVETVAAELRKIAAEAVPDEELRKAKSFAKGRFALQIESPHGLIMFGLRREVLEGQAPEPDEVIAGVEAVTAEDVQRVAHDLIADDALRLAVIGPFEDAERFEQLLGRAPGRARRVEPCDATLPVLLARLGAHSSVGSASARALISETTAGSASVVVSPSGLFSATSRSSLRMIFPERVFGSSGVNTTLAGFAIGPITCATWSRSSSIISTDPSALPLSVTYATIACPVSWSFRPHTAASATAWWSTSADSTSIVEIRCPDTFMTSSTRPSSQ
jgi:hypothetical protein